MSVFEEYLVAIAVCSPLFLFIIAVTFRLLDNSTSIFLSKEIIVDSSYASVKLIKKHIKSTQDPEVKKGLEKALIFRRLHNLFMILTVVSIPIVIASFVILWS